MNYNSKSILDDVCIKTNEEYDRIFPREQVQGCKVLVIVSDCPECGAPIYGQKQVKAGEFPVIQFSCKCHSKTLANTTHTK